MLSSLPNFKTAREFKKKTNPDVNRLLSHTNISINSKVPFCSQQQRGMRQNDYCKSPGKGLQRVMDIFPWVSVSLDTDNKLTRYCQLTIVNSPWEHGVA